VVEKISTTVLRSQPKQSGCRHTDCQGSGGRVGSEQGDLRAVPVAQSISPLVWMGIILARGEQEKRLGDMQEWPLVTDCTCEVNELKLEALVFQKGHFGLVLSGASSPVPCETICDM
jgi:hypothetical protein